MSQTHVAPPETGGDTKVATLFATVWRGRPTFAPTRIQPTRPEARRQTGRYADVAPALSTWVAIQSATCWAAGASCAAIWR